MTDLEHSSRIPRSETGFFALLRALLGCVTIAVVMLLGVSVSSAAAAGARSFSPLVTAAFAPALSSGQAPKFQSELSYEEVYATRGHIQATIERGNVPFKWHGEYAPAENGHEPVQGSPAWTLAGSGKQINPGDRFPPGPNEALTLGAIDATSCIEEPACAILHHLRPSTLYYARFVVESEFPTIAKTFEFTTLPAGKPEIPHVVITPTEKVFRLRGFTPTSAAFEAQVETNGAETEYHFELSTEPANAASWKPFTSGGSGTITVAEDFTNPNPVASGLSPETTYYVRFRATNANGTTEQRRFKSVQGTEVESFTTPTAKPVVGAPAVRNATATSAHLNDQIHANGVETHWRYEYATSEQGPWTAAGSGTVSTGQAEEEHQAGEEQTSSTAATLAGLTPATTYYVRLFAENVNGSATSAAASFSTAGAPVASTLPTHALNGKTLRVLGSVNPASSPTSNEQTITISGAPTGGTFTLSFKGQTTAPIAFDAASQGVEVALAALSSAPELRVEGLAGGPYTVFFFGRDGGVGQPPIECDASGLQPKPPTTTCTVATTQQGGEVYDTHYHFEYVSQKRWEASGGEGGFAKAASTPSIDLGSGDTTRIIGEDLPALLAGETYHYRLLATSTAPGSPVVDGGEQTLVEPGASGAQEPAASCENAQYRTGPSAVLPDCRAYEQLTPVFKEGTQELFGYGAGVLNGVTVAEDGDRVMLEAKVVSYGSDAASGQGPYFFARDAGKGWNMTASSRQPETGVKNVTPQVFSPDLSQFGFGSNVTTSPRAEEASAVEFSAGPSGGPTTTTITVPRKDLSQYNGGQEGDEGWVAASANFSKVVLRAQDHVLLGAPTGTKSGADLYEYSAAQWRQVNVGIGSCGANIVRGQEARGRGSSSHAVSADGSRVFFEAVPGNVCSAAPHLYMRVEGRETVDLGAYGFLAASAAGTKVLLGKQSGPTTEVLLKDTSSPAAQPKRLFGPAKIDENFTVADDLSAIYFVSEGEALASGAPPGQHDLYRYDVAGERLVFIDRTSHVGGTEAEPLQVSADGRYAYFVGAAEGVPGGATIIPAKGGNVEPAPQVYRYDDVERVVQCISCASPSDPEPRLGSYLGSRIGSGRFVGQGALPGLTLASTDGSFAFFYSNAALVPQDVDGEKEPEELFVGGQPSEFGNSENYSPSGDVYEWRKDGVDGCAEVQGCLALITSGRGGYLNMLLGSTPSGRDVFVYTSSQLVPSDTDKAGDIYDVRVGGGFPPAPPPPVECEGDACSTPASAPNDTTPSSSTFTGVGNALSPSTTLVKAKKRTVKCSKSKRPRHGKCVKQKRKRGKSSKSRSQRGGKRS